MTFSTASSGGEQNQLGFGVAGELLFHGQATIDTANQAIVISDPQPVESNECVSVCALAGNAGVIYIGSNKVSATNGRELSAGQEVRLKVKDVSSLHIVGANASDGVSFIVEVR